MRIYSRTGDRGSTGLVGGTRVNKTDPRIAALGAIDELNAALGLARTASDPGLSARLKTVQDRLFDLGAEIATPAESEYFVPSVREADIVEFEAEMDRWTEELAPLRNFILPGGSLAAAHLHVARTVCRRAERVTFALAHELRPELLTYLNRLSDWLFVAARWSNHSAGVDDITWQRQTSSDP